MVIDQFENDYFFLSNFSPSPIILPIDYVGRKLEGTTLTLFNEVFPSVEHAYQAFKAYPDKKRMLFIRDLSTPSLAKKAGRASTMNLN